MQQEKVVKSHNLSILKKQHINKWVALSLNYKKVIAVGETLSDILKKVRNQKVFVMLVQPNTGYAPTSR